MKTCKLIVHTKDFSGEDLIMNPKDFPDVKIKDILEIYQPEEKFSRLLLQITSLKEDFPQRDTISVDQVIASTFQLRIYHETYINVVSPQTVALDSLELTFKDQYLERGDMWRLKRNLDETCVYLNKKIEFCGIRCQVYEMWSQGDRVACGVVTGNTKVVFRSSTNLVYLFIQMSSEMWDVDINGDLYFEKAINGFFSDLFAKWKENASSHEVTIVLFSRTFYEAQSIEEFPERMRDCLQQDYKKRFYEDFYRVVVQSERYDDWSFILVQLKRIFNNYRESVLHFHDSDDGSPIPQAVNSTAAQGNFLEVLNMSLNVFEKHYLDRSFDRTGHLSVVITPGVGVFEVDRELTNITKQRIIDNGVGSDLVCLGEQPLHAVPLFKFHNKSGSSSVDDYSMPHWINLSFYSSSKQASYTNFVPRIKLPPRKAKPPKEKTKNSDLIQPRAAKTVQRDFPALVDYDEYDAQVFKYAASGGGTARHSASLHRATRPKKPDVYYNGVQPRIPLPSACRRPPQSEALDAVPPLPVGGSCVGVAASADTSRALSRSAAISIPQRSMVDGASLSSSLGVLSPNAWKMTPQEPFDSFDEETSAATTATAAAAGAPTLHRAIVGSVGSPYSFPHRTSAFRPGRALINPFDPSHVTIKLTSNRRRWTHVFPLGPTGIFMQQHHYQAVPHGPSSTDTVEEEDLAAEVLQAAGQFAAATATTEPQRRRKNSPMTFNLLEADVVRQQQSHAHSLTSLNLDLPVKIKGTPSRGSLYATEVPADTSLTLLWGATGEQEWTPALTTGVDWKSLTIPACLPLTTDYFPDKRSLQNDYVVSDYDLIPEYMNSDHQNCNHQTLTTEEVFFELVSQRLQQGFQLIVNPRVANMGSNSRGSSSSSALTPTLSGSQPFRRPGSRVGEVDEEFLLSIGRIFHKLTLSGSVIKATCLKPRHPYPTINIHYRYRFRAPYGENYEISSVEFSTEKLENFNWNYLDHYICCHGEGDFQLTESLKYMRFRMLVLPASVPGNRRILDGSSTCDVYGDVGAAVGGSGVSSATATGDSAEEAASWSPQSLADDFLKFIEVINKIRRLALPKKTRERSGTVTSRQSTSSVRRGSQTTQPAIGASGSSHVSSLQGSAGGGGVGGGGPAGTVASGANFRDRIDSNRIGERPRARTASKTLERMRSESGNGNRGGSSGGGNAAGMTTTTSLSFDILDAKLISSSSMSLDTGTDNMNGGGNSSKDGSEDSISPTPTPRKLTLSSSHQDIVDAMKHPQDGMSFLHNMPGLPSLSFVSGEAVAWVMQRVEGHEKVDKAVRLMEELRDRDFLCHCSGNPSHPFIYGFYLYHMCPTDKELMMADVHTNHPLRDVEAFQRQWFEVSFHHGDSQHAGSPGPAFLQPEVSWPEEVMSDDWANGDHTNGTSTSSKKSSPFTIPLFKRIDMDIASSTKSNRDEWGHVKYHGTYSTTAAFEIVLQWLVATGSIVTELVHQNWARRANSFGFLLVPIPSDPFALPFAYQSDPLRGPIFIPLALDCLTDNGSHPFSVFPSDTREYRMFLFQETIARRFGFFPLQHNQFVQQQHQQPVHHHPALGHHYQAQHQPQYVHTTGNMFLMIVVRLHQALTRKWLKDKNKAKQALLEMDVISSPHEEYITRHVTGRFSRRSLQLDDDKEAKVGFMWSWNYMLSKRWKCPPTGDDQFTTKILTDFRAFCSNADGRLRQFWDECWDEVTTQASSVDLTKLADPFPEEESGPSTSARTQAQ